MVSNGSHHFELVPLRFRGPPTTIWILRERLRRRFDCEIEVTPLWFDVEQSFDASRNQYNSTTLLKLLLSRGAPSHVKILGVTSVDLFIPVLSYVFGEAQLGGAASLVSSHRLDNTVYGLPYSEELLIDRLEKEATHELGHTFGLVHCRDLDCVMHVSTYVEDIDLKSADFCLTCREALG